MEHAERTVRVVIADDHTLVRQGLRRYLEGADGIEVVGEAATGDDAVEEAMRHRPDVVVLDIGMPGVSGLEAAGTLAERLPSCGVIILTAYDDHQSVVEAVRVGARGYVLKTKDAEHLVRTIHLVAAGNLIIDPELVAALAEQLAEGRKRERKLREALSAREVEVLQLLAFGHSNRSIAEKLFISPDTVKTHLEHIFQKLGAGDRTAAVATALRRHLIE